METRPLMGQILRTTSKAKFIESEFLRSARSATTN
jgi:hypothetical protein